MDEGLIICRCEEVTAGEIRTAIRTHDLRTVPEVKRCTRAGMGLCQGKTCGHLVIGILAEETGERRSEIGPDTTRPPVRPVTINCFVMSETDHG